MYFSRWYNYFNIVHKCLLSGEWPEIEVDNEVKMSCKGLKKGHIYRKCLKNNNTVIWDNVVNECYIPFYITMLITVSVVIFILIITIIGIYMFYHYHRQFTIVNPEKNNEDTFQLSL